MQDRLPSVPLITCDPYFSLWSPHDRLYDGDTCHWTGRKKTAAGFITIDDVKYRFMGGGRGKTLIQTDLSITPTSSVYTFEGAGISLKVTFLSPLLADDLSLLSRPVSYIEFESAAIDQKTHKAEISLSFDEEFCYSTSGAILGGIHKCDSFNSAWMGKRNQAPLSHSGDNATIDWGYMHLASDSFDVKFESEKRSVLTASLKLKIGKEPQKFAVAAAYDDIASIQYFGDVLKGYWAKDGHTILDVIAAAIADRRSISSQCSVFDSSLSEWAENIGGKDYKKIVCAAYRQSIAAHKLAADKDGEAVFISKECFSNGCAATVDVSYPSVPLYLIYNPELVKGMLRPIFKFAKMPVWDFDFAPHDAGRYPYVWGQVYGLDNRYQEDGEVYPPYYSFPKGSKIYDVKYQMPVEECGNMLIMSAAAAVCGGNADFLIDEMPLLTKWVSYLVEFGGDPGNQLCTDDFGGHLAHNANLSAKAIMGILAYSVILFMLGEESVAVQYKSKAADMARSWVKRSKCGDHTVLAFGDKDSWSLKYNLVWDVIFGSELFPKKLYRQEITHYQKMLEAYGTPLDNRKDYTKSDWILWSAAFAESRDDLKKLIAPIAKYLAESDSRVPFSDWYDAKTGLQVGFQNRTVQGGLFMPLLKDLLFGQ